MSKQKLRIAMMGHKHVLSREGGVEIVVKELSERLAEMGHSVVCFDRNTHHVSGGEIENIREYKGIKIRPVWTIERKGLAAMTSSFFAAILSAFGNFDVVHIHAEGPAAMCFIPKIFGKKVIVTVHGIDWQRAKWGGFATKYIKYGERQAVKWADEIVVLSKGVQDYFLKSYGRKTVFIPNGVNRSKTLPADKIKNLWNLDKDSYVLFLGRLVPEKGIKYLIEAWKGIVTDKNLVIAGGSSDTQEFMDSLIELSASDKRIVFTGFQQGQILEELYSNAYVYVLPSDLEGMPLSLLEAMSYGNCCLVSDIDECMEVVENNAVSFAHGKVDELKRVMQELLDDEAKVKEYKESASEYITGKYNWDDVVEKTLELYIGH